MHIPSTSEGPWNILSATHMAEFGIVGLMNRFHARRSRRGGTLISSEYSRISNLMILPALRLA